VDRGGERETDARRGGVALGGPTGDCSGWQRHGGLLHRKPTCRCNVFILGRSGPDRVPGKLFPAWEILFISRELTSLVYNIACRSQTTLSGTVYRLACSVSDHRPGIV